MVPWMSGLVSGLQNRVRRFESARNLNYHFKALESQALSRAYFTETVSGDHWLSLKPWGIALKFLFLHHENILFPND